MMKKAILTTAVAATIGIATLVAPSPAHAWRGGWGPGLAGGLIAGAVIGGIASSAYAYGPGNGYYGGPGYGYYGGGYAPQYTTTTATLPHTTTEVTMVPRIGLHTRTTAAPGTAGIVTAGDQGRF
jgi:hypothetical protein